MFDGTLCYRTSKSVLQLAMMSPLTQISYELDPFSLTADDRDYFFCREPDRFVRTLQLPCCDHKSLNWPLTMEKFSPPMNERIERLVGTRQPDMSGLPLKSVGSGEM